MKFFSNIRQQQQQQQPPRLQQEKHHNLREATTTQFNFERNQTTSSHFYSLSPKKTTPTPRHTHSRILCYMLLLLLSLAEPTHGDWLMDCGDCHCKWNSGKKTADCKNLSLGAVPENLSSEVQVLDLSFNRIAYLEQNAFIAANLQNLHKLFIRNSSLEKIDPRSFTQLEILIELDVSNNRLRTLQANLFARLVKVRSLVLNGNMLESLEDGIFQNLKYLHKVELKDNRLTRIGTAVFENVPLLSQIYLNGNRLSFLRKESFETLKRLTALSLDQNPWNCTCELQIFRDFVLRRNLYTPPTACYFPAHLRGMLWVEDQPEAFACKPRIIYPARGASINTSKENVTLICRVHASPNTHIAWDYNKQLYRMNAVNGVGGVGQQPRVHIQLLRDEQSKEKEFGRDVFISRLTILGAEKSDEGIYTCLAENAGGKDAVQMSLLVQKPDPRDLLLQSNLIIVIALMALGLLSVSVFLAMVTCCLYKRFKAINPGHHRHGHHHHVTAEQLTAGGGGADQTTTTVVAGDTDMDVGSVGGGGGGLSVGVDVDSSGGNYKHHHLQKTNLNGGNVGRDKYTEVIKHGVTVMDNGIVGSVGGGGGGVGGGVDHHHQQRFTMGHADNAYLERSKEDALHIKYPHGPAALPHAEITRNMTSKSNSNSANGSKGHDGKWQAVSSGGATGNGELAGGAGGRNGEYQPDLLPAYNNSKVNSNQQGQLYSPIKATRTINLQQQQQQQQQQQEVVSASHVHVASKSKFNSSTQEYLQSRYGGIGVGKTNKATVGLTSSGEKSTRQETTTTSSTTAAAAATFGIPLTTSASLAAATAALASQESGFSTLQRHSKSLAAASTTHRSSSNNISSGGSTAAAYLSQLTTPTDNSYEYRQPPPPPYNATHRTASGLLLQRRTSVNNGSSDIGFDSSSNSATKDQGYRDVGKTLTGSNDDYGGGCGGGGGGSGLTRQTIVTASPSLNFLTTTGYTTPRRQLL